MKDTAERGAGAVPHVALVYADRRERNRLIDSCLEGAKIGKHFVLIRTSQPEDDTKFFHRKLRRAKASGAKYPPSVIDVRDVLAGASPAKGIMSIVKQARDESPEGCSLLVIGDWTHSVYDRFDVALEVEEAEREMSNLLCCYRGEGFWSLAPEHVAKVFELHRKVMFGPTVLEMAPRQRAASWTRQSESV